MTRRKIEASKNKQKTVYDKSAYSENLKMGSTVIKRIIHPYGNKSADKYTGPYVIVGFDSKKAKLQAILPDGSEGDEIGWTSRDLIKLIGCNDKLVDQNPEVWDRLPSKIILEGNQYIQKVGGGLQRVLRFTNDVENGRIETARQAKTTVSPSK